MKKKHMIIHVVEKDYEKPANVARRENPPIPKKMLLFDRK